MKRTYKYALASVLGMAVVAPAVAQDNFPDVPENHWAFEALARLKAAGILVGYPDGLYRGGRPASRYELAVALHGAYQNLKAMHDGLAGQVAELRRIVESRQGGGGTGPDLGPIRDRLTALENQLNGMRAWGDDIANLKRMASTFEKELASLGVDVEAMKRDLGDLADRVTALERRKPAVDITGDANFWLGAGHSTDNLFGLDKDGRIVGVSPAGAPVGMTNDLTILNEIALTLAGTNETGPKWRGTLVAGNMVGGRFGGGFGNQSQHDHGTRYSEPPMDVYLQDFGVKFDTSVAGLGFNAEVGRVGYKVSPYIFQRVDKTSYFSNERWDNGNYYIDGAVLGFNFGSAKLDVFGGRTSGNQTRNAPEGLNPLATGPFGGEFTTTPAGVVTGRNAGLGVDRTLGVNFNMPLTTAGNLNLAYLWLDSDAVVTAAAANRVNVFGGTADFAVGRVKVEGSYAQTNLMRNNTEVNNTNNKAFQLKLGFSGDRFGLWGLYREIEANFMAPGDWGRLGILRNPTNIKGFQIGGSLNLTDTLTLSAMGEFDKGKDNAFATTTGFNTNTEINKFAIDLGFRVSSNLNAMFGFEDTEFRGINANIPQAGATGNPRYRWITLGLGYGLSDQAKLMVSYQISDVKNDFVLRNGINNYRGGFLTTQLSVKF